MNNKVFVGSVSFKTDKDGLAAHFAQVGTVVSAMIPVGPDGRSKGFGFVEFSSEAEARAAVEKLNGSELDGRALFVDLARPRENKPATGGFQR
jgi:RNA recognition motif-containing protein